MRLHGMVISEEEGQLFLLKQILNFLTFGSNLFTLTLIL